MLACYLNGVLQGNIYFQSVSDCTFYSNHLSNQEFKTGNITKKYDCICKLDPKIDPKKNRVY